jgi:hypothetical protein
LYVWPMSLREVVRELCMYVYTFVCMTNGP